jgi:hypothetical protein
MRRGLGQALRLGVAGDALALVRTSRWRGERVTVLAEQQLDTGAGLDATARALDRLLAAAPAGWPLTVVLSDQLVRLWQVTPPQGSTRMADLEAAAALRFQLLYGAPADGWKISADWDAGQPFLAAALPLPLLVLLERAAREHRVGIVEIVPQFVAALNRFGGALKSGAWFGVMHDGVLTVRMDGEGGQLAAVRTCAVPGDAGREWLDRHLAREALRLELAPPGRLQLCGAVPAGWSTGSAASGYACSVLGPTDDAHWPGAVRLACSGSRT